MGPGTTCWPGGVLKCSPGVGGSKMASRGVELLLTPHAHLWLWSFYANYLVWYKWFYVIASLDQVCTFKYSICEDFNDMIQVEKWQISLDLDKKDN